MGLRVVFMAGLSGWASWSWLGLGAVLAFPVSLSQASTSTALLVACVYRWKMVDGKARELTCVCTLRYRLYIADISIVYSFLRYYGSTPAIYLDF